MDINLFKRKYKGLIDKAQTVDKPHNIKCEVFFWNDFL